MRILPGLMMNPGSNALNRNKSFYFNGLCGLQLAEQQQDDQHDKNDSAQTHSGMAHPVAIASEPAAEAAEQENDQDDNEYHSKRHGTLPKRAVGARKFAASPGAKHIAPPGSSTGTRRSRGQVLFRLQLERGRVDAIAQSGRAGAIVEYMPEVTIAARAQHFGSDHAVADVALLVDMALRRGRGKARPAAAGIEFGIGFKQRLSAAGAGVNAGPVLVLVFAGARPFGRFLAQHRILHRRQFLPPLGFALLDFAGHRFGIGHGAS